MMQLVEPGDVQPVVRIANDHPVPAGQEWPDRSIPDLQMILVCRGTFTYLEEAGDMDPPPGDGQKEYRLQPGQVLFIEPARRHTLRLDTGCRHGHIAGAHLECLPRGGWAANDYRLTVTPERVTTAADWAYLRTRFQRLAAVYAGYHPFREAQTSAIAREILLLLAGHWRRPTTPAVSARMQAMVAYIRTHLTQPLSRQVLADAFGLSPEHVNLLFRRELGMTPTAVINRERVMAAYRLLHEEGRSVKEAAYAVGYSDPYYFSRVFKLILGEPPSHVAARSTTPAAPA